MYRLLPLLFPLLLVSLISNVPADQLAYVDRSTAENAASTIKDAIRQKTAEPYRMILYCSQCTNDSLGVWEVKDAIALHTGYQEYHQVYLIGRRLNNPPGDFAISAHTLAAHDTVTIDPAHIDPSHWTLQPIDMAYTYLPTGEGRFHCLGKHLDLECTVTVETIVLAGPPAEPPAAARTSNREEMKQSLAGLETRMEEIRRDLRELEERLSRLQGSFSSD